VERTPDVIVKVGECRCPGAPHPEDWVGMHPQATVSIGAAIYGAVRASGDDNVMLQGHFARIFTAFGIRSWSFVDEAGDPIPIDPSQSGWQDLIDTLLPWANGGQQVSEHGDQLYSMAILRPLLSRTSKQSQGGQMAGLTSATPASLPAPRKRSRRSSPVASAGKRSVVLDR